MTPTRFSIASLALAAFTVATLAFALPAGAQGSGYTLTVGNKNAAGEHLLTFAYPQYGLERRVEIECYCFDAIGANDIAKFALQKRPTGSAQFAKKIVLFGEQRFQVRVYELDADGTDRSTLLDQAVSLTIDEDAVQATGDFDFKLGNQTDGSSGKHTFVLTYPKVQREAWAEVTCNCFDSTSNDYQRFALKQSVAGTEVFDRTMEDFGEEDFHVMVWEGSFASKTKDRVLHDKEYTLVLEKNQVKCTAVPRPFPKEHRADVQLDAMRAQRIGVQAPLMVRPFIDGVQVKPDVRIAKDAGTVTLEFNRLNFPEPKVYTAKMLVYYDAGVFDDNANDEEAQCVVSVSIDMTKTEESDPIVPPTDNRSTPANPRARFTWLSGKCISLAEQVKLSAVGCVIEDTIGLLLDLVGVISTGIVVYGGFRLVIATDDTARGNAKKVITYALIGLVVVLLSFVLVQIFFGGGIL